MDTKTQFGYKYTDEDITKLLNALPTSECALAALKGRKGLRAAKPKSHGALAFIWRWARFHSGADVTQPVTSYFDLQNWVDEVLGFRTLGFCAVMPENTRSVFDRLDELARLVARETAGTDRVGTSRWAKVLGYSA